ncbi:hypothetical protein DPMN_018229 [Dreissena polymorpha]|uniref:Uncharacterized protein n=1 Tax=Dreissena polymorpha TaxID=45954 RepID=A0A9D4NIZ7_DREPO|nr:hypothetical protein DPMN_018229 [Dreissena polymorpha]
MSLRPLSHSSDLDSSSHHGTSKTSKCVNVHIHVDTTSEPSKTNMHTSKTSNHRSSKSSSDVRKEPRRYRRQKKNTEERLTQLMKQIQAVIHKTNGK